jgi:hypothetical protein
MARFENPLLTSTLTLFFLSLWTTVGGMFFSRADSRGDERESKSFILNGALIFLPPTALISVIFAMFFPLPSTIIMNGWPALLLCTAFSTLWIGLFCGLIMAMVFSLKSNERISSELSYGVGLIVGGSGFLLLADHSNSPPAVIALAGIMVIIPAIFNGLAHFKSRGFRALLWVMASCALLLDASGVYASQKLFQIYWTKAHPGWNLVKNLNTPTSQITVLKKNSSSAEQRTELLVLDNGAPLWRIPQDSQKYISGMLPATLQLDSGNLQILVIGSPFSKVPHFLLALPHVAEVTLLCPYRELVFLAAASKMLPITSERFEVTSMPPEDFLRNTNSKYDIIMIIEPSFINDSGNGQIYRLASNKLTPGGIVVAADPGSASPENPGADTLKAQFSQTMPVPGCKLLTMAGNRKLTADLNELDNRLSRLSSFREKMLPRGVLSTLYSLPEEENSTESDLLSGTFKEKLQKNVMLPPPLPVILLAIFCLAAYVVMRLFMSRTGNSALGFGAFENGFFTMGLFILLLIAYQQDKGDLYQKIPVFLGMLGGVGFGRVFLRVPHLKTVMAAISCLCPLLLYFNDLELYYSILLGSIFCMAISTGMAEEILSSRETLMKTESLAVRRYLGHTCGIVFFPLILLQSNGVLSCVILLLLFRLPLLFSTAPYQGKS